MSENIGKVIQVIGSTLDAEFPEGKLPEIYNALKILGRDVAYVQVEGENHVVVDYHKRLAWLNVIYAWFAKYLQNDATWWNELSK